MSEQIRINQPSVIFDEADGIIVVINLVTGHYFRLSEGASELWHLLAAGCTVESLAASCQNPDDFNRDWPGLWAELLKHELVSVEVDSHNSQSNLQPWTYRAFSIEPFTDLEDILGLDPIHEVDPGKGWPHARES